MCLSILELPIGRNSDSPPRRPAAKYAEGDHDLQNRSTVALGTYKIGLHCTNQNDHLVVVFGIVVMCTHSLFIAL